MSKITWTKKQNVELEGPPGRDLPWYVVGLLAAAIIALVVVVGILVLR